MQLQIFTVDAFSDRPFNGNPAAVVPHTQDIEEETLQKIASEMNLSETAFIRPLEEGGCANWVDCSRFSLRWFTPASEIPLCGHATLASAHVVYYCLNNKSNQIEFETLSGVLIVKREGDQLVMDFPANPPEVLTSNENLLLSPLVDASTTDLKCKVQVVRLCHTIKYLMIRLKDSVTREELENLQPNYSEMSKVHDGSLVKGVIVCIAGDALRGATSSKYQVLSRFLAPWYGVNEDPVTGSAHTVLGPYWAKELGIKELLCRQCCKRGGDVKVSILDGGRVALGGVATTVITGHINV